MQTITYTDERVRRVYVAISAQTFKTAREISLETGAPVETVRHVLNALCRNAAVEFRIRYGGTQGRQSREWALTPHLCVVAFRKPNEAA